MPRRRLREGITMMEEEEELGVGVVGELGVVEQFLHNRRDSIQH